MFSLAILFIYVDIMQMLAKYHWFTVWLNDAVWYYFSLKMSFFFFLKKKKKKKKLIDGLIKNEIK